MLKLLIVKTSSMGDVIHNLAIVNDVLQHHPDAQIDWVVESSFADIPRLHPAVRHVFPVALRQWRKALWQPATWRAISASKQAIAAQAYDVIVDSQGLLKSAWLSTWAQGVRHGYDAHSAREPLASYAYQQRHHVAKGAHAVERNRQLAALALQYPVPQHAADFGLGKQRSDSKTVMVLHGSSRDSKLWPVSHWIALCQTLGQRGYRMQLPWASQAELQRAQAIASAGEFVQVLPASSLCELAHGMRSCTLAIGVDTGLSHLAVALGLPTIGLYTDTDAQLTGLYQGQNQAVVNLGGIQQLPSVAAVIAQIERIHQPA